MRTLMHFRDFVNEIMESNSRLHKQAVLKKYADDEVVKRYLQICYDPFKIYGISTKKLTKDVFHGDIEVILDVLELFNYLEEHNTGCDYDIAVCRICLDYVASEDRECAELLEKLICKDLSIGCDSKTINKEISDCIPTFDVQLANKYFDKPQYVEGKKFAITTKIDGGRIIAIKQGGHVEFFTRAGQRYEGLVDLEDEMDRLLPALLFLQSVAGYWETPRGSWHPGQAPRGAYCGQERRCAQAHRTSRSRRPALPVPKACRRSRHALR